MISQLLKSYFNLRLIAAVAVDTLQINERNMWFRISLPGEMSYLPQKGGREDR